MCPGRSEAGKAKVPFLFLSKEIRKRDSSKVNFFFCLSSFVGPVREFERSRVPNQTCRGFKIMHGKAGKKVTL